MKEHKAVSLAFGTGIGLLSYGVIRRMMGSTDKNLRKIIEYISIEFESAGEGLYAATNEDWEYRSRGYDYHVGLSYGIIQFTQDGGSLGRLLKRMRASDPSTFARVFGYCSDELVTVTNRPGKARVNGRSPRVQPVCGYDLWMPYWVQRFKDAARYEVFQKAQLDAAVDLYVEPMIEDVCEPKNIQSEKGVAIVVDKAINCGRGAARRIFSGFPSSGPEEVRFWHSYEHGALRSNCSPHRTIRMLNDSSLLWTKKVV